MTAREFFKRVVLDLEIPDDSLIYADKLSIVNQAVDAVASQFYPLLQKYYRTEASPKVTEGRIDLSSYRVSRAGSETDFVLMTRINGKIVQGKPVTLEGLAGSRPDAFQNQYRLTYAYSNNQLFLQFGGSFEDTGDIVMYFPRMPVQVTSETQDIDLPEGAPMEVAIKKAKYIVQERIGRPVRDGYSQMKTLIRQMYDGLGVEISKEQFEEQIKALI